MIKLSLEKDIKVVCVTAKTFPMGIKNAFSDLFKHLNQMDERKIYGISYGNTEGGIIYKAATTALTDTEAEDLGLESFTIQAGEYMGKVLTNYMEDMTIIGRTFQELMQNPNLDPEGYCLEIYRSDKEVECLVKMKKTQKITIEATINAPIEHVWKCWTMPADVMNWNHASPDWHCPAAINDFTEGGTFSYTMAAKDGSFSFDFGGVFDKIESLKNIDITLGDERKMSLNFVEIDGKTLVTETFEPESMNPIEMQQAGWQAILNNFKQYTEQSL